MKRRSPFRWMIVGVIALILFSSVTALASTNTVPPTRLDAITLVIGINDKKPGACAGLFLTTLITGTGTINGTGGNDLILGSSSADTINGQGGNDCILGGGGIDLITGGAGNDICIGGPGLDVFFTCEGQIQ